MHKRTPLQVGRLARHLLAGALAVALGGCSIGGGSPRDPAVARPAPAADRNEQLRQTFEQTAKELQVPGAVMLLRTPGGEFSASYGVAAIGSSTPVGLDDHIRIGSNTKTWTGTVILQMVQEGKIRLADPVSTYRPDVPNGANITIEQMLGMRSGLFNYSETLELNKTLDEQPLKVWKPDELLALAYAHPPYFAPGQGYRYSNTNTVLLGLIAEGVDRKPLPAIFRDRLFKPLGLTQTLLPELRSNALPTPHPRGYMYGTNVLTMDDPAIPAEMQAAARAGTLQPNDCTDSNPSWAWAAGSGISTARELAAWVEAMNGGKVLNAEMQRLRMSSPRATSGHPDSPAYGLGIARFGPLYGHTGELPGFNSFMGNDPVNRITLIVWTNLAPAANGQDPATTIARKLAGQIYQPAAAGG